MMNFGELMSNLPAAMQQVDGVAANLERIATALERMAKVAEEEFALRTSIYDQEVLGVSAKREDDTEDLGDHYVHPSTSPTVGE